MVITTICNCGNTNKTEMDIGWAKDGSIPVRCHKCGAIYLTDVNVVAENCNLEEKRTAPKVEPKTELKIASKVTINNQEHELHGASGIIIGKDNLHYRVKIGDKAIWVPHHWVVLKKTKPKRTRD